MTASREVSNSKFYALTRKDILALKQEQLINNSTLVYLILKLENPWCDRPIKIDSVELSHKWDIPISSFYEAIARLKTKKLIDIEQGGITIRWKSNDKQALQEDRIDSGLSDPALESQNKSQDSGIDSEVSESNSPEPVPDKNSGSTHTISDNSNLTDSLSDSQNQREASNVETKKDKLVSVATVLAPIKAEKNRDALKGLNPKQSVKPTPEFLDWVIDKVKQFPNPPIFPKTVALNLIKREGESLQTEFEESIKAHQKLEENLAASSALISSAKDVSREETESIDSIFARLQAKWNMRFRKDHYRALVQDEILSHPDWNITIIGDRLELAA